MGLQLAMPLPSPRVLVTQLGSVFTTSAKVAFCATLAAGFSRVADLSGNFKAARVSGSSLLSQIRLNQPNWKLAVLTPNVSLVPRQPEQPMQLFALHCHLVSRDSLDLSSQPRHEHICNSLHTCTHLSGTCNISLVWHLSRESTDTNRPPCNVLQHSMDNTAMPCVAPSSGHCALLLTLVSDSDSCNP